MICRACGGWDLVTVFVADPMPLAGTFALTPEDAAEVPVLPLEWRYCQTCGLVNVWPEVDPALIFADYSYRASDVPALVRHHGAFATWLQARFTPRLHVEIGGNDGVLLRRLPWPAVNVDPSDVAAETGALAEPFTASLVARMGWTGKVDLITSSNAFAHFPGIDDALTGVRMALSREGRFVVEVHDLYATLRTGQWDTIYHEHQVEWSADALRVAGALHGLDMVGLSHPPLHGGMIRAVFRPGMPHALTPARMPEFRVLQDAYDTAEAPALPDGSVAYGAAARASVYLWRTLPNIEAVIDGSPRRYGRFMPGTGLPIRPPQDFGAPPAALITAPGHEDDIKANHPLYDRWVTP